MRGPLYYTPISYPELGRNLMILSLWMAGTPFAAAAAVLRRCWLRLEPARGRGEPQRGDRREGDPAGDD